MFLDEKSLTGQQRVTSIGFSSLSDHTVSIKILVMRKLPARCVAIMQTPEMKVNSVEIYRTKLTRFQVDCENFQQRLVTQDET